jgi:hypothetical protein
VGSIGAWRPCSGLGDDDLDRLFVWESDNRTVKMAAFTRADSSDRRSFDAHHHRIRDNPDDTVRHGGAGWDASGGG